MNSERKYIETEFNDSKIRTRYFIRIPVEDIIRINPLLLQTLKVIESYYKELSICDQVNIKIEYLEEGAIEITIAIVLNKVHHFVTFGKAT